MLPGQPWWRVLVYQGCPGNIWSFYPGLFLDTQAGKAEFSFQQVVTHEVGHALGAVHIDTDLCIMNTSQSRNALTLADQEHCQPESTDIGDHVGFGTLGLR